MSQPLVSVVVTTYEHEAFVGQALASVVAQQAGFPLEVIVGVDASEDATSEIVREFERGHAGVVRAIYHRRRRGLFGNFAATLSEARGTYVALLEGDDYWTDREKLARQIERLRSRPEAVVSGHLVDRVDLEGRRLGTVPEGPYPEAPTRRAWVQRLCDFHTSSLVFRHVFRSGLPGTVLDERLRVFDLPLKLALAARGEVDFVPRVMSVFRRVPGSASSRFDDEEWRDIILAALRGSRREMPAELRRVVDREIAELMAGGALSPARSRGDRWRFAVGSLARAPRVAAPVLARGAYSGLPESAKQFYRSSRSLFRDGPTGAPE